MCGEVSINNANMDVAGLIAAIRDIDMDDRRSFGKGNDIARKYKEYFSTALRDG